MRRFFLTACLISAGTAYSGLAAAQDAYCCNKTTGAFTAISEAQCLIKPNNVMMKDRRGEPAALEEICSNIATTNQQILEGLRNSRKQVQSQMSSLPPEALPGLQAAIADLNEQERILMNLGEVDPPASTNGGSTSQSSSSDGSVGSSGGSLGDEGADGSGGETPAPPDIPDLDALMENMPNVPPGVDFSNIPGMPDGFDMAGLMGGKSGTAPLPECCNIRTYTFIGAMEPDLCLAEGDDYLPDIKENLEATEVCRITQDGSGGGGSANQSVWNDDDHEENLGNAGMERWVNANRPRDFGIPFNVTKDLFAEATAEFETVFRDPDAHTGAYSVRLKNYNLLGIIPPEGHGAVMMVSGGRPPVAPAGVNTCKDNCVDSMSNPDDTETLRVDEVKSHVCGVYKGYIGPGDQLTVQVFKLREAIGTGPQPITRSSSIWRKFAFPLMAPKGELPKSGNFGASIQVQAAGGLMGGGWGNDPNTEVKVDSLHMCDPMGITAHHPKVVDLGGRAIDDDEEETKGVQTFVNLDNDDEDAFYDFEDENGVEGDDELVRIRLYLPEKSRGEAELKTSSGEGTKFALWNDEMKSEPFEEANEKPVDVKTLLSLTADGQIYRDIWIEALKPSELPADMAFEFIFYNQMENNRDFRDKIVVTALGIEEIEIKGDGNGFDLSNPDELDVDPHFAFDGGTPSNWRVFPGKKWDNGRPEGAPNDTVKVKVKLNVEPTRPIEFIFRAFDMDDPYSWDDEVDPLANSRDNRGRTPNYWGEFVGGENEHFPVEFESEEEEFEFRVTMQPGDNFRIVGGGDVMTLMNLHNDDGKIGDKYEQRNLYQQWIYDPDVMDAEDDPKKARIPEHDKYVSDMLTVWRRIWLEIDEMDNVKGNEVVAKVVGFSEGETLTTEHDDGTATTRVQQWLTINKNLYNELPETSKFGRADYVDNYRHGGIEIDGGRYGIAKSTANPSGYDRILVFQKADIPGFTRDQVMNKTITIRDDDMFWEGEPVPQIDRSRFEEVFKEAYIYPVPEPIYPIKKLPFRLHAITDDEAELHAQMDPTFDGKGFDNDPEFWIVYLINGFQGKLDEDGDSEGVALAGQADRGRGVNTGYGAFIYQESGRELANNFGNNPGWRVSDIVPHEVGHMFGGAHNQPGLMSDRTADKDQMFDPFTLDIVRGTEVP